MFKNSGQKIITIMSVLFVIECIASVFFAFSMYDAGKTKLGVIGGIGLIIFAYVKNLFLSVIGEIAMDLKDIRERLYNRQ